MHLGAAAPMRWWAPTATGIALVLAGLAQAGALAWPGHGAPLWWLHILSLAGFIALLQRSPSASSALLRSATFATAWLVGTFWWLFISMHQYGGLAAPLAALAVLALALFLASYYAAALALFCRYAPVHRGGGALFFGALWLLAELARGWLWTGFPWGAAGYAHVEGPLAVLPCGADCAIVHTASPAEADALMAEGDDAYRARLQAHFGERLHFASVGPRARYPLLLRYRPDPVGPRTVWLGNAAQTLHPVAGQGYNLALRDVWALAQVLLRADGDPGAADTLARYADARRLDRQGTIRFTDGLVRLFSNAITPLAHARGAGLFALDLLPPARHFVAKRMMFGARAWP